jgi:hypothetical protein
VICAALAWGYLLGRFCDVLSNLSPERTLFKQRMDRLNRWIAYHRFDAETAIHLREYMYATKHIQISIANRELMDLFSPKMRGEASLEVHRDLYANVAFLNGIETDCLEQVVSNEGPAAWGCCAHARLPSSSAGLWPRTLAQQRQ